METDKIDATTVNNIFKDALVNDKLFTDEDVENLLKTAEKDQTDYLENRTLKMIQDEVIQSVNELDYDFDTHLSCVNALEGYHLINSVHELQKGRFIVWINLATKRRTHGGFIADIKFTDKGVYILCRLHSTHFTSCPYDKSLIYQKMTYEEQIIAHAYEQTL